MAKALIDFNETLAGPKNIQDREYPGGVKGWTHIINEHDALVSYLLLTCFDLLGQPDEWVTFEAWLASRRHQLEREAAAASAPTGAAAADVALHLSREHTKLYGAKRSFYRFINERLTAAARGRLLLSISVRDAGTERVGPNVERDKLNFLYDTRNAFTHRAEAKGQYARAIGTYVAQVQGSQISMVFYPVRREGDVEYFVQGWPFTLYELVAEHIGETVPAFHIPVSVGVTLSGGRVVWTDGYTYTEVHQHTQAIAAAAEAWGLANPEVKKAESAT
ncbi:MAG: hypothetical protein ABUL60_04615 [Myxococcales bacterium]